jgi:hypothetical protein
MIYYIEYSREHRKTLSFLTYPEAERSIAQAYALKREIELSRLPGGLRLEIVILEADSEATIRNSHKRYFADVQHSEAVS